MSDTTTTQAMVEAIKGTAEGVAIADLAAIIVDHSAKGVTTEKATGQVGTRLNNIRKSHGLVFQRRGGRYFLLGKKGADDKTFVWDYANAKYEEGEITKAAKGSYEF